MTVKNWIWFSADEADRLRELCPQLADQLIEITKSDLDAEVVPEMRPMAGKFVLPMEMLDGHLTRKEVDRGTGQLVDVPDDGALTYVVAATGRSETLVADSELLF